ncbi:MAG: PAS domain S-box protein [Dehalococcoidales bacterium]
MSEDKSKKPLLADLKKLRQRVADLEAREIKRVQAEEALKQSEEYSSTILNHSPNPILVANPDTSIRYVNPALEKLTGYSMVELVGQKAPYPWWTEEALAKLKRDFKEALTREVKDFEQLFKKKSGERFWVEITMTPIKTNGEFKYYLASWVDITERRRAEEALHLRAHLLNEATDSIIATDLDGNLIYMNEVTCRTRGYSKEEMLHMNLKQLVPPETADAVEEKIRRVKEEGTIVLESAHLRKDGSVFPVEASARIVNLGDQTTILFVIRDITERKQAEEVLRESEERYRALLELGEGIGEAVVMLQDDERGRGMHVYASDKWALITGYSKDELLNMSLFDLVHPDAREETRERYERRLQGEVLPGLYEVIIIRKDGSNVPVEGTYAHSSYKGKLAIVGYIRDISERKKMEEQLIVTDRLASIGELASGVAHELNNPLTGIIGFSELLLKKNIAEEIKEDLKIINREAQRTALVVRNLLTFARRHETSKEPVDINQAIQSVLDLRAYEQKVHNIEVVANFDPNLPKTTADLFRLQQVFINIIINAEHFMTEAHGKGTLTITTESDGDVIRASFADDGPGIREENIRHLFDPFFTTKEVGKGTGLGLSICHGIVTEHGGQIYAESESKKGATFTLELPVK